VLVTHHSHQNEARVFLNTLHAVKLALGNCVILEALPIALSMASR